MQERELNESSLFHDHQQTMVGPKNTNVVDILKFNVKRNSKKKNKNKKKKFRRTASRIIFKNESKAADEPI